MELSEILFRGQIRRKGEKVNMPSGEPLPSRWCYGADAAIKTIDDYIMR